MAWEHTFPLQIFQVLLHEHGGSAKGREERGGLFHIPSNYVVE